MHEPSPSTEAARPDLADLDLRPTAELVRLMTAEELRVVEAVAAVADELARVIDAVTARMQAGGRLVYLGAGSAGRVATQDAAEISPTYGVPAELVVAVLCGGPEANVAGRDDLEDDTEAGPAELRALGLSQRDSLVAVSASGRTGYTLAGLRYAAQLGCLTVAVVNNAGTPAAALATHALELLTGPEVIAGSTRLKAASAQKLALNTLSTAVMVRLGYTLGNLMTGVRADNDKLRRRVVAIVAEAAQVDPAEAAEAVRACGGEAAVAILVLRAGIPPERARQVLAASGGRLREALTTAAARPRSESGEPR